jgi:N-acetylglucosaminyldiphosphoundecaprenol N-acetyl-beta-D-mannosaminyltransferase
MPTLLGVNIIPSGYNEVVARCIGWAKAAESLAVFLADVHMIMEARDQIDFRTRLNVADMVNPDGMPVVWALRALGYRDAHRVYGPDAMLALLCAAQSSGTPIGFYGGNEETLARLVCNVEKRFPGVRIVLQMSPPFRLLSEVEDARVVNQIAESGARILFVGLGCPKQENWIIEHRGSIPAVMLGVGAAFDFLARTKPQAPRWMMRCGLEWIFRLASEPRRLAGRYLKNNPRFVALFILHWMTGDLAEAS